MLSYNAFNEAFGSNNDQIDNLARDLNNKKKSMYNNVLAGHKTFEQDTIRGIEAFSNEPGFQFAPQSQFYNGKTGEFKGDFKSGNPTPLEYSDDNSDNNSLSFSLNSGKSFGNNMQNSANSSSQQYEHFNDISSEYSYLPKKKKKHLRLNTTHLQEYTENDDHLILEHIKKCNECKQHLLKLVKNDTHFTQKNEIIKEEIKEDNSNSLLGKINYKEMKEVIILIIIGIIVIFVLDIFLRR
jgi:hypothetical protein